MKAVVYSFTRRGAMLSINIGEALQKFDFEVRCLTMPKFAEEKIFLEAMDDHNKACEYAFKECQLIVFVGAVGIAVRTIAPSTDEVVKILQREGIFEEVISGVTERIDFYMQHRVHGKIKTAALMFSNVYGILGKTAAADELIKLHLKDKQEG